MPFLDDVNVNGNRFFLKLYFQFKHVLLDNQRSNNFNISLFIANFNLLFVYVPR